MHMLLRLLASAICSASKYLQPVISDSIAKVRDTCKDRYMYT